MRVVTIGIDDRRVTKYAIGVLASSLSLMFPALLVRRTEPSHKSTPLPSILHESVNVALSTAVVSLVAVAASHKDGVSELVEFDEFPAPSPGVVVVFAGFPFRFPRRSSLSDDNLGDDVGYVLPCKIV